MTHRAAVLVEKGLPLVIKEVAKHKPSVGEVLIKTKAVASNPVDSFMQRTGFMLKQFPVVIGSDLAGVVDEVGENVAQFKKGDRVYVTTNFFLKQDMASGAYQEYVVCPATIVSKIPERISFEEASTLTLAVATAGAALYGCGLNLPRPTSERKVITAESPVMFIHNAASVVGHAAVQFGVISGFRVIASASPKNFEYILSTGASHVFDYRDPDLLKKVKETAGKPIHTAFNVMREPETAELLYKILTPPGKLALCMPGGQYHPPEGIEVVFTRGGLFVSPEEKEIAAWWFSFLREVVEIGSFVPIKTHVVGTRGVEDIQKMLDFHGSGQVSACKPVVTFE